MDDGLPGRVRGAGRAAGVEGVTVAKERYWQGRKDRCDVCGELLRAEMHDAAWTTGQWACMCPDCWRQAGSPKGVGRGQAYVREGDRWRRKE